MALARDLLDEVQAEVEHRVSGTPRRSPVLPKADRPKVDASAFAVASVSGYDQETGEALEPVEPAPVEPKALAEKPATALMAQLQASLDAAKAKESAAIPPTESTEPIWLQKIAEVGRKCTIEGKDPGTRYTIKAIRGENALVHDESDPFADAFLAKIEALDVETRVPTKEESAAWRAEQGLPPETIPDASDVEPQYATAFGVRVERRLGGDWALPYTKTGGESDGGQCKAVNTAFSEAGFGGKLRHRAASELLSEIHGTPIEIDTLDQLTRGDAATILEWFDRTTSAGLADLSVAIGKVAA